LKFDFIVVPLILGSILSVRRSATPTQSFGVAWLAVMLAGAIAPLNFLLHYFIPVMAPAIYVIAVFRRGLNARSAVVATVVVLAPFAVPVLLAKVHRGAPFMNEEARTARVAGYLRTMVPAGSILELSGYEPGVFLASGMRPSGRFDLAYFPNEAFVTATTGTSPKEMLAAEEPRAAAIVDTDGSQSSDPSIAATFETVCSDALEPWRLYVRRTLLTRQPDCRD
jgi:hypothetical protein